MRAGGLQVGAAAVPAVPAFGVAAAATRLAFAGALQLPPLVVLLECSLAGAPVALKGRQRLKLPALLAKPGEQFRDTRS